MLYLHANDDFSQNCLPLALNFGRVGKCHGYDGYIRVKKLASLGKKFGTPKLGGPKQNKKKQATFWKICATSVRPSGQTSMD